MIVYVKYYKGLLEELEKQTKLRWMSGDPPTKYKSRTMDLRIDIYNMQIMYGDSLNNNHHTLSELLKLLGVVGGRR